MSRLNQWAFRGFALNQNGARVRDMTGIFGLPPLRGDNFLTMGQTGQLFVPKLHDQRTISLAITVYEDWLNGTSAQGFFDQLAILFANRTQGALTYTDLTGYTRTGQAECVGWTPADQSVVGTVWTGVADFLLADPWLYGTTITGNVVPNAGIAFAYPVSSNISGPRTTWSAALTGVTSGQPLIVIHATQGYTTALTSIADTFGGHYTYVRVDGNNTGTQDLEIYVGTGGTGTSGTVTVTAPSGLIGGYVFPMTGASVGVGLATIDVHGNQSGTFPTPTTLQLTPTAPAEAAIFASLSAYPLTGGVPLGYAALNNIVYLGTIVGNVAELANPSSGIATPSSWTSAGATWNAVGAVIKGTGTPVTLSPNNIGTARAEKLTIDILGPLANPTILNQTNGLSLTINATVAAGTHCIVDTGAFTCMNNGVNSIGSIVHSGADVFMALEPGVNTLQVSGAVATGATLVTVSFAPPFV